LVQQVPGLGLSSNREENKMSFLDDLGAEIHKDFDAVAAWGEKERHELGDILLSGIKEFATEFGPLVLSAAKAIVPALVGANLSGAEKKDIAVKAIGNVLLQQGAEIGTQVAAKLVNLAIEKVYNSLPIVAPVELPAEAKAIAQ
jgi:hypothetical protein